LFWLAADLVRHGRGAWLLSAILGGALIVAGLALREYLEHLKIGEANWRVFGRFTNPNFLASYLIPSLLLTLAVSLRRPDDFKPVSWALALGLVTATLAATITVTGSRGGLYSLAAGLVVFVLVLVCRRAQIDREAWLRLGGLVALMAVVFVALSAPLRTRGAGMTGIKLPPELCPDSARTAIGDSNQFRVLTWKGTLKMGAKRPVMGWGAGSYETAYAPHAIAGFTRQAHNGYLQLFAEEGVPGVLLWVLLLLVAFYRLLRALRAPEWFWLPGLAGALVASTLHNLLDSVLFVPAVALLIWALLGMATARSEEPASEPEPARRGAARPARSHGRTVALVAAVLGIMLAGSQVVGLMLLKQGSAGMTPMNASERLETLRSAEKFLPWDLQVARMESRAYANMGLDHLDDAIREGHRMVRIAPYRMPTYQWIGTLYRAQNRPDLAMETYKQGLRHAHYELMLLYAYSEVLHELGERAQALKVYERLVEVEASPVGQVRALSEVLEWRFARAHIALANVLAKREPEQAFEHRRAAACLLAQRRQLYLSNPVVYLAVEDADGDRERSLQADEERLWNELADAYRRRGEAHTADLALEMAGKVDADRERLEKIIAESHDLRRPE
jgi:putative inorganic carbon (HCO3(-)) transporter